MADQNSTAPPAADPIVLGERIRQLGAVASFLRRSGHNDMAREVERERARLRGQRDPAPVEVEVSVAEAVDLLAAILEALTTDDRAMLVERAEWVRTILEPVLRGTQDFPFATSFLRTQTKRLQPAPDPAGTPAGLDPATLTPAQRDGRACVRCGAPFTGPGGVPASVPVATLPEGGQLFVCSPACPPAPAA